MLQKEYERQQAVHRVLDIKFSKEKELQEIVELAAKICGTPSALITLIDQDTHYVKFQQAFDFENTPRQDAFCNYVIEQEHVIVIPDTLLDRRFAGTHMALNNPSIRFYAGAPLSNTDGHNLGSLCVIGHNPGSLTPNQVQMLKALAKQVIQLISFDATLKLAKDLYLDSQRSEIELRSFFESSVDQHLLLGRNFEILAFNRTWESHVKNTYGLQMVKGKPMTDFINGNHLRVFHRDYLTALKGKAVYDERNLRQHGRDSWRMVKFEPALDAIGLIIGVSVNVADISEKVKHEMTVRLQQQQLHEIALIQSHEFRKPVASIMGLMNLIRMDGRYDDMEEWLMLEKAVLELDEKIKLLVGHTSHD